jgi:hypothetical protein
LLVLCVVVAMVGGLSAFQGLPRLEDPIIANRNPIIVTLYPGASASKELSDALERCGGDALFGRPDPLCYRRSLDAVDPA